MSVQKSLTWVFTFVLSCTIVSLLGATPTWAQSGWQGEYFNNETLSGTPVLVRNDANINFNWGAGSPGANLQHDNFSARWTRTLNVAPGTYRFSVAVDDGVRLWVSNSLVIDEWREQGLSTYTVDVYLAGGPTPVRLEYFERSGGALIQLAWTAIAAGRSNQGVWRGEYFNNVALNGQPTLVRNDVALDFTWGAASPAPGVIEADGFGVRWTRTLNLPRGRYRFTATTDDGVRLWVNQQLIIDAWQVRPATASTAEIDLNGNATVQMEYFENSGDAIARLVWAPVDTQPMPAPSNNATASVIRVSAVNVRTGPSTRFRAFTTLQNGQTVALLGRNQAATWLQVRLADGAVGWVSTGFLASSVGVATLPITN